MQINYPYKFRLEPTQEQEKQLYHFAYTCRLVYNIALDRRKDCLLKKQNWPVSISWGVVFSNLITD